MGDKNNRLILHSYFILVTNVIYITGNIKSAKKKDEALLKEIRLYSE